jgi:hypothetical protein
VATWKHPVLHQDTDLPLPQLQIGVFSPSLRNHYLNVTPNNLVHIYSPDSRDGNFFKPSQPFPKVRWAESRGLMEQFFCWVFLFLPLFYPREQRYEGGSFLR